MLYVQENTTLEHQPMIGQNKTICNLSFLYVMSEKLQEDDS